MPLQLTPILEQLDDAQASALSKLRKNKGGAVFHRVGTGKTRIALAWFASIAKKAFRTNPIFLVVTRRKAFEDWLLEARAIGLNWIVANYETYAWKITTYPRILLVSHGMIAKLATEIEEMGSGVEAIVYDEGFLFKSPSSAHCKAAHKIAKTVGRAAILSGSIMTARNLEDVFGQMYAIGFHQSLGRTLTEFRTKFMVSLSIGEYKKFVNSKESYNQVSRLIAPHTSIHMPPSDKVYREIVKQIDPSPMQVDYLERLREDYWINLKGQELDIKSVPVLIVKCQQISDGFIHMPNGSVINVDSSKLAHLVEQLFELIACGERVIVWCAFRESVMRVLQMLQSKGIKAYGMVGGSDFNSEGWRRDGQVVVATEDSGSSVNHFAQCAYAIYYSMNWRWLALQQSKGRSDRKSSKHKTCFYYYLQLKDSLDSHVYNVAHRSGREETKLLNQIAIKQWLHKKL